MSRLITDCRFAIRSLVRVRSVTMFAVLAFALGIGITTAVFSLFYGVTAYNVRRTRRDFGIRLALGADPKRVRRLVVLRGFRLGALGVVLGAGGAILLTRTMDALLSDVKPSDPCSR
jgi:putative ABC transport system permease protein